MRISTLFAIVLFVGRAAAQSVNPGAAAAALGGSFIVHTSPLSAKHNVAGIANLQQNTLALGVRSNYLATALNDFYVLSTFNVSGGRLGVDFIYFGFDAWQQGEIGLSYARPLVPGWFAGTRISYTYNYIPQERLNRQLLAVDLGFLGTLGRWRVGVSMKSLAQSGWRGRVVERAPIIFRFGGGYFFSEQTALTTEIYKSSFAGPDLRLGLQYAPAKDLIIRAGFGTLRPSFGFGVEISVLAVRINLAATWHQQLGLSPISDVVYAW